MAVREQSAKWYDCGLRLLSCAPWLTSVQLRGYWGSLDGQSADGWNRAKTPEATRRRAPMAAKIAI